MKERDQKNHIREEIKEKEREILQEASLKPKSAAREEDRKEELLKGQALSDFGGGSDGGSGVDGGA